MHTEREKEVLLLMIDPMEGLTNQILLGQVSTTRPWAQI